MDVIIWSFVFIIQNAAQLVYALYKMKKINFPSDIEDVYTEVETGLLNTQLPFTWQLAI